MFGSPILQSKGYIVDGACSNFKVKLKLQKYYIFLLDSFSE